ncbi:MAG: DUF975 family protein [Enterococcus cecorum]|nr:DUF975 family protein [Enterococcus cecorum]
MSRAELKLQAKYLLKGRYTQAILICLIPTLLSIGITYTGFLASTVYAMIHSSLLQNRSFDSVLSYSLDFSDLPSSCFVDLISFYLLTAIFWTFINLSRGKKTQISLINDGFQTISRKHLIPLFCLYILRGIFLLGWSLLLIIPGIIKGYAYSQAEFVYYDLYEKTGERPDLLECLKRSEQMMKGHKFEYFVLDLSFIGWQILCFMTLGLGYLWLNPYMYMTKAVFYNELAKKEYLIEPDEFH